jgi:2-desacetyl-2-hydroxyethyl bacteriochlorophyllide A dehydrogenase
VCLKCEACRSGNWRYCKSFREIGFRGNGAYAEYICVPAYGLCELPDTVSFHEAAMAEPLGVALGTLEKSGAAFDDSVLIIGAGSIGLCMLAVAKAMGLKNVAVAAYSEKRLEIAESMGAFATIATSKEDIFAKMAKYHPEGSDIVIDCTGMESCIQDSLKLAKKGGAVVLAGYGRGKIMNIRMDDIHINNLRVIGAGNNWNKHKQAVSLMERGAVDMKKMITEKLPLEDYARGIAMARMVLRSDGPSEAAMIMAMTSSGRACMMSISRCSARSIQPPR